MASTNAINSAQHKLHGSSVLGSIVELKPEKISCSFTPSGLIEASRLLGLAVFVDEYQPAFGSHPAEIFSYRCEVTGVLVGSQALGRASQLSLRVDGADRDELVPISYLTVRAVEPSNLVVNEA